MAIKKTITALLIVYVVVSVIFAIVKETLNAREDVAASANAAAIAESTAEGEPGLGAIPGGATGPDSSVVLQADRVILYYFHRNLRCVSCIEVEEKMHEVIDEFFHDAVDSGILEVQVVNFDLPENEHFIEQYNLYYSGIVFVEIRSGVEVGWDDFAEVWTVYGDDEALVESIRSEIAKWVEAVNPS